MPVLRWSRPRLLAVAVVLAASTATFVPAYLNYGASHPTGDWLFFKVGAYVLLQVPGPWRVAPLHLYAANPDLQIGPPPLLLTAGAVRASSPATATLLLAIGMLLLGVAAALLALDAGERLHPGGGRRARVAGVVGALVVAVPWAWAAGTWRHLDDCLALAGLAVAVHAIARRGAWWVAPVALGVAAASKPWAVIFAPLVLTVPARRRAPAVLVLLAAAGVWWAPFVLAAPQTLHALGSFHVTPSPGSVPALLGLHGNLAQWLRSTQFSLGAAAGAAVVLRRRWEYAPLAALAARVALDPYAYSYYSLGPLLAAYLLDAAADRRLPVRTVVTLLAFDVAPLAGADAGAAARLAWVLAAAVLAVRARPRPLPSAGAHQPAAAHAAAALSRA